MEQWKQINDFEDYQISNYGRVKSFKQDKINGKILAFGSSGDYYTVILRKDNKPYNKYIHRLVAEHFIENPLNLPQVNHLDENTHNNHYNNLEWISEIDNYYYGTRCQRAQETKSKQEAPHKTKIRCVETGQEFNSISEAARFIGVSGSSLGRACRGLRKTCKGFHWEKI